MKPTIHLTLIFLIVALFACQDEVFIPVSTDSLSPYPSADSVHPSVVTAGEVVTVSVENFPDNASYNNSPSENENRFQHASEVVAYVGDETAIITSLSSEEVSILIPFYLASGVYSVALYINDYMVDSDISIEVVETNL